jgi:hypothetical protein
VLHAAEPVTPRPRAAATDPVPAERQCDYGDFMSSAHLQVASVREGVGRRVHFFRSSATCPEGAAPECSDKAYLVPKDTVAVAKHRAGFACAWYQRKNVNDRIVGWLPAAALEESAPPSAPPLSAWVSEWSRFVTLGNEARLTITLEPDGRSLRVTGEAEWMSTTTKDAVPNLGGVSGVGRPEGNRLIIQDEGGDCGLELFLLDTGALFAREHHHCGGMNVTFEGLY